MNAEAPTAQAGPQKQWWLRALAIFQSPRPVFAALRDESRQDMEAREEPVLAIILLAGIAGVLMASGSGRLLDEDLVDDSAAVLAVLVFLSGAIYGIGTYWIGGAALYVGMRGAGSRGSYRRARHVLAFSALPLVLGLMLVWPVRLAIYGLDSFRTGGSDTGAGDLVFDLVLAAFALWALGLLVYGISVVERWRLLRAAVSLALAVLAVLVLTFPFLIPLASR
jgi:hypothetical protein